MQDDIQEHQEELEDHDRGLAFDLATISTKLMERRRALAFVLTAGASAIVAGCGGGGSSSGSSSSSSGTTTASTSSSSTSSSTSTTSSTATTSSTSTTSSTTTTTSTTSTSNSCVASPQETGGPYPADGTNTSSGSTSDILTQSGIVRSDIRSSFISTTTTAQGVQLSLTLSLVNSNSGCAALSGYAIYVWHCDASGDYSLYTAATESYLRGVQVTDSNGQVTFTSIFPACYSGRWPHIHIEVYQDTATATTGKNALLTTQLAMPTDIATTVFSGSSYYTGSTSNFAQVSESTDQVFASSSTAQLAQQTPTFTGSVSAGYTATATVGMGV